MFCGGLGVVTVIFQQWISVGMGLSKCLSEQLDVKGKKTSCKWPSIYTHSRMSRKQTGIKREPETTITANSEVEVIARVREEPAA